MTARSVVFTSALLSCLSTATCVQASPFSVMLSSATGADGAAGFTLAGDTTDLTGDFKYKETEEAPDMMNLLSTNFDDPNASFTILDVSRAPDAFGGTAVTADFIVSDPNYQFVVSSTNGSSQTLSGFSLKFLAQVFYAPGLTAPYDVFGSATGLLIPPPSFMTFPGPTVVLTGSVFAPVPLPASAPMVGVAVLALGAAGYAAKRKKPAPAS